MNYCRIAYLRETIVPVPMTNYNVTIYHTEEGRTSGCAPSGYSSKLSCNGYMELRSGFGYGGNGRYHYEFIALEVLQSDTRVAVNTGRGIEGQRTLGNR